VSGKFFYETYWRHAQAEGDHAMLRMLIWILMLIGGDAYREYQKQVPGFYLRPDCLTYLTTATLLYSIVKEQKIPIT